MEMALTPSKVTSAGVLPCAQAALPEPPGSEPALLLDPNRFG